MTVDRQRELIASEARLRQAEEPLVVPTSGSACRVPGCGADTRLGTLTGGEPMLCNGFGLADQPCIARWLMETDIGSYEDWLNAQALGDRTRDY